MTIRLCYDHHQGNLGVHFNKQLDLLIKRQYQAKFEAEHGHDKFMEVFGRSYL